LLLVAIVGVIASLMIRVLYGAELIIWEDNLYKSLGLEPILVRSFIGVLAAIYFVRKAIKQRKKKKYG